MKAKLKNEDGLTLIEVLAAFAIGTILLLLIGSTLLFGLRQYNNQSAKAQELADVTYVAKVITKEIRKATMVSVDEAGHSLTLTIDESEVEYKYDARDNIIYKNGRQLYSGIDMFELSRNGRLLAIKIASTIKSGSRGTIETEIYIREGVGFAES